MTGNEFIDVGLENIWESWWKFKKGKTRTKRFYYFESKLENNLLSLHNSIKDQIYQHGSYRCFMVCDNKKRKISEAQIRDKIVHRLIYDYLIAIYDKSFDFDVWSCRKGKGIIASLLRTKKLFSKFQDSFVWKADIRKFFDNVDHELLLKIIHHKIKDHKAIFLIERVLNSYSTEDGKGIPLGNLTSQIFANIYLNEFDRFVRHRIKPDAYLRYGDDFILIMENKNKLTDARYLAIEFLDDFLKLNLKKGHVILKVKQGMKFLGMKISSESICLNKRNCKRVFKRLNMKNLPSYYGLVHRFGSREVNSCFHWEVLNLLEKHKPSPTDDKADYCSGC